MTDRELCKHDKIERFNSELHPNNYHCLGCGEIFVSGLTKLQQIQLEAFPKYKEVILRLEKEIMSLETQKWKLSECAKLLLETLHQIMGVNSK